MIGYHSGEANSIRDSSTIATGFVGRVAAKNRAHFRPAKSDTSRKRKGRSKRSSLSLACVSAITSIGRSSRSSCVPPSLRYGAAFSLRARRSSKSEGGILTTADKPGRIGL
jgi:hypothetical protein